MFTAGADDSIPPPPGAKRVFVGFRLTRIDPGSLYETVGLREGDLLKSINGRPVRDPADLKELPGILERDKKVEIKVERGTRRVTLRYAIKTVARAGAATGKPKRATKWPR